MNINFFVLVMCDCFKKLNFFKYFKSLFLLKDIIILKKYYKNEIFFFLINDVEEFVCIIERYIN